MSFTQKFSKLPARIRTRWILAIIVIFAIAVALAAGGSYYNKFAKNLAEKTNQIVVLPLVKEIPFSLGLDLQGGTHLVYKADVTDIPEADRAGALESVRDVIERRVNSFGVSEPIVQVNRGINGEYQVIAELAGIKDVKEAIQLIGETPILEFKELDMGSIETIEVNEANEESVELAENMAAEWKNTELTGKYLKRASLQFNPNDGTPEVSLEFNDEGAKLFEEITARNINKPVAIFLDGYPISTPTVNEKITGGSASISGRFTAEEAKLLVKRLNSGALPAPISLVSQKTVEASLGNESISDSMQAGLLGLLLVSIFMILFYRLPGVLSVLSLLVYGVTILAIFKPLPVWFSLILVITMIGLIYYTFNELKLFNGALAILFSIIGIFLFVYAQQAITLTLSGIAGFILSIGVAVDANILIFSRTREELKLGKTVSQAVEDGFKRAWPSIRDGNVAIIITCLILMFFGTSTIKGFGTTLFIGVAVSMFSAIVISHTLFVVILGDWLDKKPWLLGVKRKQIAENK